MNRSRPALLALAFAAAACARADGPERADQSADVEAAAIRAMDARLDTLIANRDTSALVAMYAPHAIVMPMEFPTATDTAAIRRIWVAALSIPQLEMRFTPMKLEIATSGDLAVSAGTFTFNFEGPSGPVRDVYQSLQG